MNTLTNKQLDWVQRITLFLVVIIPPFMLQITCYAHEVIYAQITVLALSIAFTSYQLVKQNRIDELKRKLWQVVLVVGFVFIAMKVYHHFYVDPQVKQLLR